MTKGYRPFIRDPSQSRSLSLPMRVVDYLDAHLMNTSYLTCCLLPVVCAMFLMSDLAASRQHSRRGHALHEHDRVQDPKTWTSSRLGCPESTAERKILIPREYEKRASIICGPTPICGPTLICGPTASDIRPDDVSSYGDLRSCLRPCPPDPHDSRPLPLSRGSRYAFALRYNDSIPTSYPNVVPLMPLIHRNISLISTTMRPQIASKLLSPAGLSVIQSSLTMMMSSNPSPLLSGHLALRSRTTP